MSWSIRRATPDDVARVAELRMAFLAEVGRPTDDELRASVAAYLDQAIPAGDCVVWLAQAGEDVVAIGAMSVYERMAWSGVVREGYVLSMYTVPDRRGTGIGAAILDEMQTFARSEGLRLCLIALDAARPIYERAGFAADPRYMRWRA